MKLIPLINNVSPKKTRKISNTIRLFIFVIINSFNHSCHLFTINVYQCIAPKNDYDH